MSMISEQIADLKEKAQIFENSGCATDGIVKTFRKAADTIEELSAKLAINSQPPADQWIPCSSGKMPENGQTVVATIGPTDTYRHMAVLIYYKTKPERFTDNDWQGKGFYHYIWGDWIKRENVIAWMPAEPYKGVE